MADALGDGDRENIAKIIGDVAAELLIEAEEPPLLDIDGDSVGEPVVQLLEVPETDGDTLTVVE